MEIGNLTSFLAVVQHGGIQAAARQINSSASSLSKAISKLEHELGVSLFERTTLGLQLTKEGQFLKKQAVQILLLEERTRQELQRHMGTGRIKLAGPDILLANYAPPLTLQLQKLTNGAVFEFQSVAESQAIDLIKDGQAHIALITGRVPTQFGLTVRILEKTNFRTFVGKSHPLFQKAKSQEGVSIHEVLRYPFAVPETPLFSALEAEESCDGWRDHQFPRQVRYVSSSLKILESFVEKGQAVAYLPDFLSGNKDILSLEISGCPFECQVPIKLVCKDPNQLGWMRQLF